jgi:PEGA domain/Tetratricopeptide repeat
MRAKRTARTTIPAIARLTCLLLGVPVHSAVAQAQTAPGREQASIHFDRGLELIEENAYDAAVVEFERAYELSPNHAALYNLGMAYIAAGRPVDAVAALSRYLDSARQTLPPGEVRLIEEELQRQRARIGLVSLTVEPRGARVKVDSRDVGTAPLSTPIALATGSHTIEVTHPGYDRAVRSVAIAGQGKLQLHIALHSVLSGLTAQLPVRCSVPEVTLLIDDGVVAQPIGAAPVLTSAGPHELRFRRAGYADAVQSVVLAPGMSAPVDCALRVMAALPDELAAQLVVRVDAPGSELRLDGGSLPPDGRVPLGRHRLAAEAPGFRSWSQDIVLAAGERRVVTVDLQRTPAAAAVDADGGAVQRDLAYVLGGVGLAAGVAALATFFIAEERYSDWQDEKAALAAIVDDAAREPPDPELQMELARRVRSNNDRLKSVWQLDTLSAGLAIGGGALLATGAVLFLFPGGDEAAGKGGDHDTGKRPTGWTVRGSTLNWVTRF